MTKELDLSKCYPTQYNEFTERFNRNCEAHNDFTVGLSFPHPAIFMDGLVFDYFLTRPEIDFAFNLKYALNDLKDYFDTSINNLENKYIRGENNARQ